MGKLKTLVKQAIVKNSVKKRKRNSTFDEYESEYYALPIDADLNQNNSYYFSAHSSTHSLFIRLGIRGGGEHEVWFAYYNKDGTAYVNDVLSYNVGNCPIRLRCIEPLKKWEVSYNGFVKKAKQCGLVMHTVGERLQAQFNGVFTCSHSLYDFTRDGDEITFARAVAAEKWSGEFFKELSENTQVHTEQAGVLTGKFTVDKHEIDIALDAMRDHSYGKRSWDYMNRHIWLMAIAREQNLNVSMVSYPVLSELRAGYTVKDGITVNVVDCDSMTKLADTGVPDLFKYSCIVKDGSVLHNTCTINAIFPFSMGDGKYTIYEGIADFTIDGVSAKGIAEFGYNIDETRWKK